MTTAEEPGTGPGPPKAPDGNGEPERERVVVRDKRRLRSSGKHAAQSGPAGGSGGRHAAGDSEEPGGKHAAEPATGEGAQARPAPPEGGDESTESAEPAAEPGGAATTSSGGLGAELAALRAELDDRTRDLQRLNSEYANYRRRVERDRTVAADEATAAVFRALLPVLDDFDRAREHGELAEGVAAIVDQLIATGGKFGLSPFGERGDPFDPTHHEAVAHLTSPEVTETTCVDVLRRGYLLGERLLRPAMVAVADPGEPAEQSGQAPLDEEPGEPDGPGSR